MDLYAFEQQFNRTSVTTDSKLRQTVQQLKSDFGEYLQTMDSSIHESSIWFRRQTMCGMTSERTDRYRLLLKYLSELDCEHLELIGVEQQIFYLSLKCRTIRENIISKTNLIHSVVGGMVSNPKQMPSKQTQTDLKDSEESQLNPKYKNPNTDGFKRVAFLSPSSSVMSERRSGNLGDNWAKSDQNSNKSNFTQLSDKTKKSLNRLPALVKGYLTRRLMKTEKVLQKLETISEIKQLLSNYNNPSPKKKFRTEDNNFHKRLINQLENSCHEFYDIFFNYPKSAQMVLICQSRQHILERHYRTGSVLSTSRYLRSNMRSNLPQTKHLSSVTKRVIERKIRKKRNSTQLNNFLLQTSSESSVPQTPKPSFSSSSTTTARTVDNRAMKTYIPRLQPIVHKNSVQNLKRKSTFY